MPDLRQAGQGRIAPVLFEGCRDVDLQPLAVEVLRHSGRKDDDEDAE